MKKVMALIVCLSLVLGSFGCAQLTAAKNFLQNIVLEKAEQLVCTFTDEQAHQAEAAAIFVISTLGYADVTPAIQAAVTTFLNVRDNVCIKIDQLQEALAVFDKATTKQQKVTFVAPLKAPNIEALRELVK